MKKLLLLLGVCAVFTTNASHFAGGELTYKYIGDSTGNLREYIISLYLYRDLAGINIAGGASISYESSCNSGGSLLLPLKSGGAGGDTLQSAYDCASPNQPNAVAFSRYYYETTIILPSDCADWVFYWVSCCRNNSIGNIQNPGGQGYVIKANLNNLHGPNSSPQFLSPAARQFCLNITQPVTWNNDFYENDNDSIAVVWGQPLTGAFPGTPISWSPGYSISNPISTVSGIYLNPTTGSFTFQPAQLEVAVMKIDILEYRFDTINSNWINIGTTTRELQIPIVANCVASAVNWGLQVLDSNGVVTTNSVTAECGDKSIFITTNVPFSCKSLSSDGSDFLIYKSNGTLLPIVQAKSKCVRNYSTSVELILHDTISKNDTLHIISHIGSDFNTLVNYCGFDLPEGDSIELIVNNCSNISLNEESTLLSSVYPNPSDGFYNFEFKDASPKRLLLFDLNGRLLHKSTSSEKNTKLDLASFQSGFYWVRIEGSLHSETIQLIKN